MTDQFSTLSSHQLAVACGGGTSSGTTSLTVKAMPPGGAQLDVDARSQVLRSDRQSCALGVQQLGGTSIDITAICGPSPQS